jgi:hypothetical protein
MPLTDGRAGNKLYYGGTVAFCSTTLYSTSVVVACVSWCGTVSISLVQYYRRKLEIFCPSRVRAGRGHLPRADSIIPSSVKYCTYCTVCRIQHHHID